MSAATPADATVVEVEGKDLPLHCPNPRMPVWSSHPRVFLDIETKGEVRCPYCGTAYRLRPGSVPGGHH